MIRFLTKSGCTKNCQHNLYCGQTRRAAEGLADSLPIHTQAQVARQ